MVKDLQKFMRIALLAIALLAVSFGAKAQTWHIMGEYIWSPPHPTGTYEETHYQAEDVMINGMEYHTIYIQGQGELLGAYRNEGNQVYYCKWNGSDYEEEVILYDYDLEEGDFFNDEDPHPMEVTSIYTITDFYGVTRKVFEFSFIGLEEETEFWIEGIGSSKGFVNSCNYTPTNDGAIFHLLCYHVGDELIYINPEYNSCDIDEIEESDSENGLNLYPNPANSTVKIANADHFTINKIEVIDLLGRTVARIENNDEIDVSALPKGQYVVKITGETTLVKKLTVTK